MAKDVEKQVVEEGSVVEPPPAPDGALKIFFTHVGRALGDRQRVCRLCNSPWTAGDWNFYNLCPTCFEQFDRQKMQGRSPTIGPLLKPGVDYFEDADAWIEKQRKERSTS